MNKKILRFLSFILAMLMLCSCTKTDTMSSASEENTTLSSEQESGTRAESDGKAESNKNNVTYTYCNLQFEYSDAYTIQDASTGYTGVSLLFDEHSLFILGGADLGYLLDEADWGSIYQGAHEEMRASKGITETDSSTKVFLGKPALFVTGTREKADTGETFDIEMIYFILDTYLYTLQYYGQDLALYRDEYEAIIDSIVINPEYISELTIDQSADDNAPSASDDNPSSKKYTLGSLQMELHSDILWDTLTDEHSDYDKVQLFRLPVTMTNLHGEDLPVSVRDFSLYGPAGAELDDLGVYYTDDAGYLLNIEAGQTVEAYFTFQYEGSGEYLIAFDMEAGALDITFTMP